MNNKELPKAYEPSQYEEGIYKDWEDGGYFKPNKKSEDYFSVSMPPPNVTGVLHLGHALENSIMDIEVRFQRMRGKKTLLLPGTDHAAVATQAKVEKVLIGEGMKKPREELGREGLLEKIREYAEESKVTIIRQIKKLGTSADWSRLAYTFDDERSRAVNEVFIKMYNDGLIYKGYRTINWSVKGQSTLSDDELEYRDEKTKLYTFRYAKDFPISIATTRPETKLGDTAVAVNPKDDRYKEYIGKVFTVDVGAKKPLEIKIIADEEIDMNYGTGAIGVTPAHSMVDFEMYEKNGLELIQVIGADGKMTEEAGPEYAGLALVKAREKFVGWLKDRMLLEKEEEIDHNVATSDRFGDVVEIIPMKQWFVDVNKKILGRGKSLKELMREAVTIGHGGDKNKKITIVPDRFNNQYFHWIDNLRDWCISRQIWWGHRIPVWYKDKETYCGFEAPKEEGWVQDPDTLDTWFSSGLWTFSTLGWPEQTEDFKTFHPTSWMQMGYEILFFWMARMILMSTYALDDIPFKNVYIHGILRDKEGRKFSKSLGNGIDPIEVIEKYGADALRLSLILGITPGNDSKFYEEKVESSRNFVNKLWNVSRYIIQSCHPERSEGSRDFSSTVQNNRMTSADAWILSKMRNLISDITSDLENYNFSQAGEKLREFTWNDLADWYLEVSKFEKSKEKDKILSSVLKDLLKLWHPFIPFVTEAIWSFFAEASEDKDKIIVSKWPDADNYKIEADNDFELIKEIITVIRNARSENKIEPAEKVEVVIYAGDKKELIESQGELIKNLRTGIEKLDVKDSGEKIGGAIYITVGDIEIYLIGAIDPEKEKARIKKEIENLEKQVASQENKLNNKQFTEKAPENIVADLEMSLTNNKIELEKLQEQLNNI